LVVVVIVVVVAVIVVVVVIADVVVVVVPVIVVDIIFSVVVFLFAFLDFKNLCCFRESDRSREQDGNTQTHKLAFAPNNPNILAVFEELEARY